jgi:hypothetical protein
MARVFAVTASTERLRLDSAGRGEVSFTISNTEKRLLRSRVKVQPLGAARADWFSLAGEPDRDLAPDATHQVTVRIAAPATATGTFTFQLRVVSIDNPDEDWTDGPVTAFEAAGAGKPAGGQFPWWILLVGGAVVLVAGGVLVYSLTRSPGLNDRCDGDECQAGLVCGPDGTCLGDTGYKGCEANGDCASGVCRNGRCDKQGNEDVGGGVPSPVPAPETPSPVPAPETPSPPPVGFRVIEAWLQVDAPVHAGRCPVTLRFRGRISAVGGSATVSYRFLRSDGATGPVHSVTFDSPGSKDVETTWRLGGSYRGWQALKILDPQEMQSERAAFQVTCR